jgi:hypothetical protein
MFVINRTTVRTLAVASLLLAGAGGASAQTVIVEGACPPAVTYYQPAQTVVSYSLPPIITGTPTVSYYTPRVAYSPVRSVSYYPAPTVSYYASPAVSYYPGPVSTTRYGIFGQPRESRMYYPTYVLPR